MLSTTRIFKNFSYLTTGSLFCQIIGFILYVVLARYLGPTNYGVYSLALSFMTIFVLMANFGLDTVYIRDVSRAKRRTNSYFYSCMILKIILSIASIVSLIGIMSLLHYSQLTRIAIMLFSVSIFFQTNMELLSSLFKAYEVMKYSSMMMVLRSVMSIIIVLSLIYFRQGVLMIIIGQSVSFFIAFLVFYIFTIKKGLIRIQYKLDIELIMKLVHAALPFVMIGIVHIVNLKVDILVISYYLGERAVGLYGVANELIISLLIIPTLLSSALFPFLSRKFKDKSSLVPIINLSTKGLITLGVPVGAGILIFAPAIITLIFGDKYVESATVLWILGLGLGLTYARLIFSWLLTAINLVKYALLEYVYCLIINLFLNILLVPQFGIEGAAIATVASSIFGNLYLYYQTKRFLPEIKFLGNYCKPIIGAAIMVICLRLVPSINLGVDVMIGVVVYSLMAILLKIFTNQDYLLFKGTSFLDDSRTNPKD